MSLDYFTQARLDYYYAFYKGKTKEQLFKDLDEVLKEGIQDSDSEQRMKLLVIEEELLKIIPGYELLKYYKSKIKFDKLIIDDNNFDGKQIIKHYKALTTKAGIKALSIYSIPAIIFVSVLLLVPASYTGIQVLNLWIFGILTLIGFVWLLVQPLIVYALLPLINSLLEVPRIIIWFIQVIISSLRDYLKKNMNHI